MTPSTRRGNGAGARGRDAAGNEQAQFIAPHPEMQQYAPRMLELAQQHPGVQDLGTTEALGFLLSKAKSEAQEQHVELARQIARAQAEEQDAAIRAAAVASSAASVPQGAGTVAEQIGAAWDELDAPYVNGWNVNV